MFNNYVFLITRHLLVYFQKFRYYFNKIIKNISFFKNFTLFTLNEIKIIIIYYNI